MNKDSAVEKALVELGLKQPPDLTPEQEEMFQRALDPEKQYLYDIEQLFKKQVDK